MFVFGKVHHQVSCTEQIRCNNNIARVCEVQAVGSHELVLYASKLKAYTCECAMFLAGAALELER